MPESLKFPFAPGETYSIGELRLFERELSRVRQADTLLSKTWRVPDTDEKKRWVKIREETYPIKLLADHKLYPDSATFRLAPYGAPKIDAEINLRSEKFSLQITIADPVWIDSQGNRSKGGYDHRLTMEGLNKSGFVHGSGLMRRENGKIVSGVPVRSFEQELAACKTGLVDALKRKLTKGLQGCRLLVYARGYELRTMDSTFDWVVKEAVTELHKEVMSSEFEKLYFADEGAFAEFSKPGLVGIPENIP